MQIKIGSQFRTPAGGLLTVVKLDWPVKGRVQVQDVAGNRFDFDEQRLPMAAKKVGALARLFRKKAR